MTSFPIGTIVRDKLAPECVGLVVADVTETLRDVRWNEKDGKRIPWEEQVKLRESIYYLEEVKIVPPPGPALWSTVILDDGSHIYVSHWTNGTEIKRAEIKLDGDWPCQYKLTLDDTLWSYLSYNSVEDMLSRANEVLSDAGWLIHPAPKKKDIHWYRPTAGNSFYRAFVNNIDGAPATAEIVYNPGTDMWDLRINESVWIVGVTVPYESLLEWASNYLIYRGYEGR